MPEPSTIPITITVSPSLRSLLHSTDDFINRGTHADKVFLPIDGASWAAIKEKVEAGFSMPVPSTSLPRIWISLANFSLRVRGANHYEFSGMAYLDISRGLNIIQAGQIAFEARGTNAATGTLEADFKCP